MLNESPPKLEIQDMQWKCPLRSSTMKVELTIVTKLSTSMSTRMIILKHGNEYE